MGEWVGTNYSNGRGERSGGCTSRPADYRAAGDRTGFEEGWVKPSGPANSDRFFPWKAEK